MDRQIITPELSLFPECFHSLMRSGNVYDSSCSPEARVWYIEKNEGFYLKAAPRGSLKKEAEMTRFFHEKGLSAQVLSYESREKDWLLTKRIPGEDCTHASYLQDPERLSALLGERLRSLHDSCGCGCPVPDRTGDYLDTARRNREAGRYDLYFHPDAATVDDAWRIVEELAPCLARDTLLHGDYCLPNIMLLDDWQFSGFIDLGCGGMGDRHVDLFWGVWTLEFNLHTPRYRDRFLDAYGRDRFNPDILPLIGAIEVFG